MTQRESLIVSSTTNLPTILQKAEALAVKLNVPFTISTEMVKSEYILSYNIDGLRFLDNSISSQKPKCLLYVDFVGGKSGYRLAKNCTIKQPLARAVGIKSGFRPTVFDATAGLGTDSFVLASLGCNVIMCERSPILGALLEDGLKRALVNEKTKHIVSKRLQLIVQDSLVHLQTGQSFFHTIYLDPMYPHRKQSALNKQTLRSIRDLVGDDLDADNLLKIALKRSTNRVVVKRPAAAPYLAGLSPTHTIDMKNGRFDVYLTRL
ncbi:MAG: class I SAM-dependent methyltransferase [Desulforhopalus sp.]